MALMTRYDEALAMNGTAEKAITDESTIDGIAEAIGYAGSMAADRAEWLAGLVERCTDLKSSEVSARFREALKASAPSEGLRDAHDRLMACIGASSIEDAMSRLQKWGEERQVAKVNADEAMVAARTEQQRLNDQNAQALMDLHAAERRCHDLRAEIGRERAYQTEAVDVLNAALIRAQRTIDRLTKNTATKHRKKR